ncbi:MAG: SHOCT domain-containing protein [Halanaeroarchaeum sp.]
MSERNGTSLTWILVLVLGVIVVLPLLTMGGGMMGGVGLGMLGGGMFLGPLLLLGLVILIAYGVTNGSERQSGNEAVETLRERYARGEIDEEEFEERRRMLEERNDG